MVDFELLSESPRPTNALELLERLLTNRRRQWQLWMENPPHFLGICLLLTVALELAVSVRLFHNQGAGPAFIGQFLGALSLLLLGEVLVLLIASKGGEFVGKKGNFFHGMTFLNLSLTPLLLYLPITLACWLVGGETLPTLRGLALFMLTLKVLSNWKEAVEATYKLSKVQSAIVMYVVFGLTAFVIVLFMYVAFINTVAGVLS